MTVQPQNNNLNYLINPTFTNVNRLFVLSFRRNNNTASRYSYSNYYEPKVEIIYINVLIDEKSFFDLPAKNEEEAYEKIIEMSNNNDYTMTLLILLDFGYLKKNNRLIAVDLSKQTKLKDPQHIGFIGKHLKKYCSNNVFHHQKIRRNYF